MTTGDVDLLIVGSGVAGLSAAVRAAALEPGLRIGVVTKGRLSDSATQWAQGGVAAVMRETEAERGSADSIELHAADTMRAGAGLCDWEAVDVLVTEGPPRVRELASLGAVFDRTSGGKWKVAREGGHSTARVVHAGGAATGAEVERALVEAAGRSAAIIDEHCQALDLIVENGRCGGVLIADRQGHRHELRAAHTLLGTGGAGQLYSVTTNPAGATGDGVGMALRAGVAAADVEFVQFHPTALYTGGDHPGPRALLSEALRGEGGLLRDAAGRRFVDELQPRDVVAAAVAAAIRSAELDHVWLDVSSIEGFERRFPTLAGSVRAAGLHPGRDWIPVAPAAHYLCGAVVTDLDGATTLPGLWAAGEVACSGVHGANRLASNSLLEGLVFAARAVEAVLAGREGPRPTGALRAVLDPSGPPGVTSGRGGDIGVGAEVGPAPRAACRRPGDPLKVREAVQRTLTEGAGVVRDAESLASATADLEALAAEGVPEGEAANLVDLGRAVLAAATARRESRGGHRRLDYPEADPALSRRFVQW